MVFFLSSLLNRQHITELATGTHEDRGHLDKDDIREQKAALYKKIREDLETVFDLTLLEGSLTCDDFHKTKKTFASCGEKYGYIHSFTERADKSNAFRFQYRRPTLSGNVIRKNLTMNRAAGGYTPSAFKSAGHDLEKSLCMLTEKYFLTLRKESKTIRSVLRKLKAFENELENEMP